ncbi:MAG: acyltransferase family protein [Prevotella sp.]|nr:acyltransferase family protein [Prevotella sp.]
MLTLSETKALRGIAILGIVLHNYCHFLGFAVKENEYTFTAERPRLFLEHLLTPDANWLFHVFSFLGHYGVPIFLFVSGLGLVLKYERAASQPQAPKPQPSALRWMGYHFLKLFRLMVVGYVLFVIVYIIRHDDAARVYSLDRVVTQLTMTINFMYFDPDHIIKPGPYWFFGLMVQLYLLYRLVLYRWRNCWVLMGLVVAAWLVQRVQSPDVATDVAWLNFIRYNFVGGVLPFCLGVAWTRWTPRITSWWQWAVVVVVSAVGVLVGSLWFASWLWVPLFIVTGAIATVKLMPARLLSVCEWFGVLSSALFVMHPLLREITIWHYAKSDIYSGLVLYMLASVAASMLLQWFMKYVPKPKP